MGLGLGAIFYVSLLLINAIAILNEERFLARIGWSSVGPQGQQYNQYDRTGYGEAGSEVKSKLINLIGAVRTLLRTYNKNIILLNPDLVENLVGLQAVYRTPTATGSRASQDQLQDRPRGINVLVSPHESLHPRQTPIVVSPPSGSRIVSQPQPTSLNYWWPYGPNGVNPTATATPISSSGPAEMEETDTVEDTSTDIRSSTLLTSSSSTFRSSASTSTTASTMAEATTTDSSSEETDSAGPTTSGDNAFSIVTLLPLFIILGVIVTATLAGWAYGRCIPQCRRNREPTPGGPDIGGKPYEGSGYDHDTIGPLHSLGVSWVDASRIHSQHDLSSGVYYAIRDSKDGEPGTPSKNKFNKRGPRNWFRHTLSRRKCAINSPSGEKGLNAPLTHPIHDHQLPADISNTRNFGTGSYLSPVSSAQSPKTLWIINTSPATGTKLLSPTSSQPTPFLPASRHPSLRRKIANRVKEHDNEGLTSTTALEGAFGGVHCEGRRESPSYSEYWAVSNGDPRKDLPNRRYTSPNTDSRSSLWSPDPEVHRERMHRLRIAAEAAHRTPPVSDLPLSPQWHMNINHPLPPAPAVLLSPPLQPQLFFTQVNSDGSDYDNTSEGAVHKLNFAHSRPNRNSNGHPDQTSFDEDSFGPRVPLNLTSRRVRKGKARAQRQLESTETLPLSPELRGAAMTKLDEIVKSHWSVRNLAELPRSPTLYGALSLTSNHYAKLEDEPCQPGIEEMLLASPEPAHT